MTDSTVPQSTPQGFDHASYQAYVEGFDMTKEQKSELLRTVWDIMRMFVEMGFDVPSCDDLFGNSNGEGEPS